MPVEVVNLIGILQIQYIDDDRHYLNTKKRTRFFVCRANGVCTTHSLRRTLFTIMLPSLARRDASIQIVLLTSVILKVIEKNFLS